MPFDQTASNRKQDEGCIVEFYATIAWAAGIWVRRAWIAVASLYVKAAKSCFCVWYLQILQIFGINNLCGIRGLGTNESLFLRHLNSPEMADS